MQYVPVVSSTGKPLMPCHAARCRQLVRRGKGIKKWRKGLMFLQLTERADGVVQEVVLGVDPGSKKEAFTIKSENHTFVNLQADAVTHVKDAVKTRREMRRGRRFRKTPCRASRKNRERGGLVPSTKARWQWKLRVCRWLMQLYPIACFVVEDIKAATKPGQRRWNRSFSPLEVGKQWFYGELRKLGPKLELKSGWDTYQAREGLGLKKIGQKLSDRFGAHCVDSWVLANEWAGGHLKPENTQVQCLVPLRWHRRQLHRFQPGKGGIRQSYGGTHSLGFKRGSLVRHILKHGLSYVGGTLKGRLSLHSLVTSKRLCRNARSEDCTFLTRLSWRLTPALSSTA